MPEYAHDFSKVTSVGIGAFAKAHFDGAVNLPKVRVLPDATYCEEKTIVGADHDYGVFEESNLETINLSNLTTIGKRAFINSSLHRIYASKCTLIKDCEIVRDQEENPDPYAHGLAESGPFDGVDLVGEEHGLLEEDFSSLLEIGAGAFNNCALDQIPNPITAGYYRQIGFSNKIKKIKEYGFSHATYTDKKALGFELDLPEVEEIGDFAFWNSKMFFPGKVVGDERIIDLPECTKIGADVFRITYNNYSHCRADKIYLPKIQDIGPEAFRDISRYNNNITMEIHIGKDCSTIGFHMLQDMSQNTDLYLYATEVPSRNDYRTSRARQFELDTDGRMPQNIYVPDDSVDLYKQSNIFSRYESIIKPMTEAPNAQDW